MDSLDERVEVNLFGGLGLLFSQTHKMDGTPNNEWGVCVSRGISTFEALVKPPLLSDIGIIRDFLLGYELCDFFSIILTTCETNRTK